MYRTPISAVALCRSAKPLQLLNQIKGKDQGHISPITEGAGHVVESGTVGQQVRLYYHQDLRGTVDYLTSPVSQKVESWTHYNEWGEITHNAVLKMGQRELDLVKNYTGHDFDAVLNLYYAKARMYDAENRRFVSIDPILDGTQYDLGEYVTDPARFVQYLYVKNNPLIYIDPLGLIEFEGDPREGFTTKKTAAENKVADLAAQQPVLTRGAAGHPVYELQRKLAQAGYYHYTGLDGSFGAQTEAAVKAFQAANGLEPDGSVGPKTWTKLLAHTYTQGPDTQDRHSDLRLWANEVMQQNASRDWEEGIAIQQKNHDAVKAVSETGFLEITTATEVKKYAIYAPQAMGKYGSNDRYYPERAEPLEDWDEHITFTVINWGEALAKVNLDEGGVYGTAASPGLTLVSAITGGLHAIANSTMLFAMDLHFSKKSEEIYVAIELSTTISVNNRLGSADEKGYYYYAFNCETPAFFTASFEKQMGADFWTSLNIKYHFDRDHLPGKLSFYLFVDQRGQWLARPKKYENDYVEVVTVDPFFRTINPQIFEGAKYDLTSMFLNTLKVDDAIKDKIESTLRSELNAALTNDN